MIRDIVAGEENGTAPVPCWGSTDLCRLAAQSIQEFAQRTGQYSAEESAATVIQGLLTDLIYLCDQEGITSELFAFQDLVSRAETAYLEEGL